MDDNKTRSLNTNTIITFNELKDLILPAYFEPIKSRLSRQKMLIENTEKAYQSYYERIQRINNSDELSKYINETNWLKNKLYQLLENEYPEIDGSNYEDTFVSFHQNVTTYINSLPSRITKIQAEERFIAQTEDSFKVKSNKKIKNFLFHLSKSPIYFINLFRSRKKEIKRWKHTIPLQALHRKYFLNQFMLLCLPFFEELQKLKCGALNVKWSIDKDLNDEFEAFLKEEPTNAEEFLKHVKSIAEKNRIEEVINEFDRKLTIWEKESEQILKKLYEQFLNDYEKVGTIELSRAEYSGVKLNYHEKICNLKFQKINNGWKNTLFTQIDDFQIDLELYRIKYGALLQFQLTQKSCKLRIFNAIKEHITPIENEVNKIRKLSLSKSTEGEFMELLKKEKNRINQKLQNQIIPQAVEAIYNQNLPNLVERLMIRILDEIGEMKSKRIFYAKNVYNAPISKSELNHFNPRELVELEPYNKFSTSVRDLKTSIVNLLENIEENIVNLIAIVDYNLDAAINAADEEKDPQDIQKIANEGLIRIDAKTDEVKTLFNETETHIIQSLKQYIAEFNKSLIKLTENENILAIKVRLAKAKAADKTENYKRKIVDKAKSIIPLMLRFIRQKFNNFKNQTESYAKKLGLLENKEELSAELSDFLAQTDLAIEKLPYVYKRLYKIKPTEEEVFFEGRLEELNQLKSAHANWVSGNYSSTVITGEKGSGASSLLNFFLKDFNKDLYIRHKLIGSLSTSDELLRFFQVLLKNDQLTTFEALVNEINNSSYSMIILEDLQHMYLKKIHGFEAFNMLFEVISQTSKKIFWLVEFTSYAWNYLTKTIGINRYFKFAIELKSMSNQEIVNIIMKRHRVSGYNLKFEVAESKKEKKKLSRLSPKEKVQYQQKKYFEALNKFAQSNISLALLYWLRSTKSVENNTIIIGPLEDVNFSFLSKLPQESIFTLYALLLHDSLSIEEHASLFNQSKTQSRLDLMVLEDKGILYSIEERYLINRLLYRQIANVLSRKNIIH